VHVIYMHFCNKTLVVLNERVLRMSASSHVPLHIAVFHSVNVKYASFRLGEATNARSKNMSICYDFPYASRIYVSVCVVDCTHSLDS
jgi:hypothetical protein